MELANLGYPGFRRSAQAPTQNPATLVLAAIVGTDVEVRVIEALPWLAIQYPQIDCEWLIRLLEPFRGGVTTPILDDLPGDCHQEPEAVLKVSELGFPIETILDRARLARPSQLG